MSEKEVYYHQYCPTCLYYGKAESEDPCDECLSQPVNEDSHKPYYYKQDGKKKRESADKCGMIVTKVPPNQ